GEAGRHREAEGRHLGEARAFSAEKIAPLRVALGGTVAEEEHAFRHRLHLVERPAKIAKPLPRSRDNLAGGRVPRGPRCSLACPIRLLRGGGGALFVRELDDVVLRVDVDDVRTAHLGLGFRRPAVVGDDDQVARPDEVRGGAVDADLAGAALAGDDVRGEPPSVRDVVDVDLLVLEEPRGFDQRHVDRDRPDAIDVGARDGGSMDLTQQKMSQHVRLRSGPWGTRQPGMWGKTAVRSMRLPLTHLVIGGGIRGGECRSRPVTARGPAGPRNGLLVWEERAPRIRGTRSSCRTARSSCGTARSSCRMTRSSYGNDALL